MADRAASSSQDPFSVFDIPPARSDSEKPPWLVGNQTAEADSEKPSYSLQPPVCSSESTSGAVYKEGNTLICSDRDHIEDEVSVDQNSPPLTLTLLLDDDDLLALVLMALSWTGGPTGLLAAGAVCRRWNDAAGSNHLWRELCRRDYPAAASLSAVASFQSVYARLARPTQRRRPPPLEQYQFLVRICAGDAVLLDVCKPLSATPYPALGREHRYVHAHIDLAAGAVPEAALESQEALVDFLGELAVRNTRRESPWRLTVSAFRSSDQRCALLIDSGVSEGCVPTDYAGGHEQLEFGDFETRLFSLDAERLALREGVELKAGADLAFLVVRTPAPSWDEGWYLRPELWLKAHLRPYLKAPRELGWALELLLEASGCEAVGDPVHGWAQAGRLDGQLQHELFLQALNEALTMHG